MPTRRARTRARDAVLTAACGLALALPSCGRTEYECRQDLEGSIRDLQCGPSDRCAKLLSLDARPPQLLLVLDRSCSMRTLIDGRSKWAIASEALVEVVEAYPEILWGGALFPDHQSMSCLQGEIPVRPGKGKGKQLVELLLDPFSAPEEPCETNLGGAVEQVWDDEDLRASERRTGVLLVTDAYSRCGSTHFDIRTKLTAMFEDDDIQTFVVGFEADSDFDKLNEMAIAGGAPDPDGPHSFYVAGVDDLGAQVAAIVLRQIDCAFEVPLAPNDLRHLTVRFDYGPAIARSTEDGWYYDQPTEQLMFAGSACARLERREVESIDIELACSF